MTATQKCRACGAVVHANAPLGHCPKCLLEFGFGAQQEDPQASARPVPGSGQGFGDYELLGQIGRGGMGIIYKARQVTLNRMVALKMVRAGELATPALIQRFHLEAEAAANLHHPNIVPIYETGDYEGQHFFSMELIDGKGLNYYITSAGFSLEATPGTNRASRRARAEQIASIISKVARAVDYAHQHGVLHRDLKPSNVLLDSQGEPRLTDFGVAKVIGHVGSSLTASGTIMGTPSYMAPEQAAGQSKRVTTAADVYSLGAILYEMLTGHAPFRAETPLQTLKQVVEQEPRHPTTINEAVDSDLATICMKCLEKEPQRRYPSAAALAEDLERWQRKEPIEARPAGPFTRVQRWVQRNPVPTLLIFSLFLGFVGCLGLLHLANEARRSKDRALNVIKQGLEAQLNDLWLDTSRIAFERITPAQLAVYGGSDWSSTPGPTNRLAFGLYTYTKPAVLLRDLSPILLRLGNELARAGGERVEIEMLIFGSYEHALRALEDGRLHFMRMGPASYLQAKARNTQVELLCSQVHSPPLTLAIFTRTNSGIYNYADLRGRSFAFGDTNSTTGNFVAKWVLLNAGLHLADLAGHAQLNSQSKVINAVVDQSFDAGAANYYDFVAAESALRTIGTSRLENLGLCWVAGPSLERRLVPRLRECFLALNGAAVLTNLESAVTGFRVPEDGDFDELRHIMRQADLFAKPPRR